MNGEKNMKKIISVLIILVLILSGCSSSKKVEIKNNNWEFSRITEKVSDDAVYSSEENKLKFPEAKVTDIKLTADKSTITITDSATDESWTLEYEESKTATTNNTQGRIYDVYYKNGEQYLKGYATTGVSNMNDVSMDYYLIITIGENSIYFIDTLD